LSRIQEEIKRVKTTNATDYVQELIAIMARLRGDDGCPWDREQNHDSLKEFLAEEAAELFDAIDDRDDEGMCEELGDVLLQVVFHAQIAAEEKRFNLQDIARTVCEKLVRRHPHVFADSDVDNPDAVLKQWDAIKKTEKPNDETRKSALGGVPRSLPALHRAHKIQKKAARVGFDWPSVDGVIAKIEEELAEVREAVADGDEKQLADEIGDLLFAVVNLSRYRKHLAENLLHSTIAKFERRFSFVENKLQAQGLTPEDTNLKTMDEIWNEAKKQGL
jgi:tetrapyrrole methylase family protein / MazG family protein